jgi:hypothetical protein
MANLAHKNLEGVKGDITDASSRQGGDQGYGWCHQPRRQTSEGRISVWLLIAGRQVFHEGCLEHGVKSLLVQTDALFIAPTSMMTNEKASSSFLESYILHKIFGPYFNVFHGCHVDNDVVTEYFSGLDDAANQQLNWTLTRPTESTEGATRGQSCLGQAPPPSVREWHELL